MPLASYQRVIGSHENGKLVQRMSHTPGSNRTQPPIRPTYPRHGGDFHVADVVRNRESRQTYVVPTDGVWLTRFYELVYCPHVDSPSDGRLRHYEVEFGLLTADRGASRFSLVERLDDPTDDAPFKLRGVWRGTELDESFGEPSELLCYVAALVEASQHAEAAVHSPDAVAVEARVFLRSVLR